MTRGLKMQGISGLEKHRFTLDGNGQELLPKYEKLVGQKVIEKLKSYKGKFKGKIVHINSTFEGGGVAELLQREVQISNELGINMEWFKILGKGDFFSTTKGFHNALQGKAPEDPLSLIGSYNDFYMDGGGELNNDLIRYLNSLGPEDILLIHDPQPLYLINFLNKVKALKLWRIHIDTTTPEKTTMDFVVGHATKYHGIIATLESFMKPHINGYNNLFTLHPSIDPFSDKNIEMDTSEINSRVYKFGIKENMPLLVQVSRLDIWKDPVGVIKAFDRVREKGKECQLALVYNSASDDPEGVEMEKIVKDAKENSSFKEDIHLVIGDDPRDVNAFQRYASAVIQNSVREGFGLTVTEALYKEKIVIATDVGGIKLQVKNRSTGYSVRPYEVNGVGEAISQREYDDHINSLADKCFHVLNSPEENESIAKNARANVLNNFLAISSLKNFYDIILSYKNRET